MAKRQAKKKVLKKKATTKKPSTSTFDKGLEIRQESQEDFTFAMTHNKQTIAYLEKEILPKARTHSGGFMGMVPIMKDGVLVAERVSSLTELEAMIEKLKKATFSNNEETKDVSKVVAEIKKSADELIKKLEPTVPTKKDEKGSFFAAVRNFFKNC